MERLTNRDYGENSCAVYTSYCDACHNSDCHCGLVEDMIEKLADYEDLEEQGRLIKLPCKEAYTESGDIVYLIYDDEVVECTHCGLSINPVDKNYISPSLTTMQGGG